MPSEFEAWLTRQLRAKAMTRAALAVEMGVDPSTITKWAKNPDRMSSAVRQALHQRLGMSPSASVQPIATVYGATDGIPDHCLIQLAHRQGYFRDHGLEYVEFDDHFPLPRVYPETQRELARRLAETRNGSIALAVMSGQERAFRDIQPKPKAIGETNGYIGFALITLLHKALPDVHSPTAPKAEVFRHLFQKILARGVGGAKGRRSRFACMGPLDCRFVSLLLGLYCELLGQQRFDEAERSQEFAGVEWAHEHQNLEILDSLDDVGIEASDIVIGDALTLGAALADKKRYKILMTLTDAIQVVNTACSSLEIRQNLERLYKPLPDDGDVRGPFCAAWKKRFGELEQSVDWYVVHNDSLTAGDVDKIVTQLKKVKDQVRRYVTDQQEEALTQILDIVKQHRPGLDLAPGDFRDAWRECYSFSDPKSGR